MRLDYIFRCISCWLFSNALSCNYKHLVVERSSTVTIEASLLITQSLIFFELSRLPLHYVVVIKVLRVSQQFTLFYMSYLLTHTYRQYLHLYDFSHPFAQSTTCEAVGFPLLGSIAIYTPTFFN